MFLFVKSDTIFRRFPRAAELFPDGGQGQYTLQREALCPEPGRTALGPSWVCVDHCGELSGATAVVSAFLTLVIMGKGLHKLPILSSGQSRVVWEEKMLLVEREEAQTKGSPSQLSLLWTP